jgi:hypothetical protein
MSAQTFRKKPVEIEAILTNTALHAAAKAWDLLPDWLSEAYESGIILFASDMVEIRTLEGRMTAHPTDWIIRGVKGEIYPCKPDIFEATYDEVKDTPGAIHWLTPNEAMECAAVVMQRISDGDSAIADAYAVYHGATRIQAAIMSSSHWAIEPRVPVPRWMLEVITGDHPKWKEKE